MCGGERFFLQLSPSHFGREGLGLKDICKASRDAGSHLSRRSGFTARGRTILTRKSRRWRSGGGGLGQAGTARGWTRVVIHPAHPMEGEFEFLVHTGRPVSTCEPHVLMSGWAHLSEQTAVSA